jgi:hypothetical protein
MEASIALKWETIFPRAMLLLCKAPSTTTHSTWPGNACSWSIRGTYIGGGAERWAHTPPMTTHKFWSLELRSESVAIAWAVTATTTSLSCNQLVQSTLASWFELNDGHWCLWSAGYICKQSFHLICSVIWWITTMSFVANWLDND